MATIPNAVNATLYERLNYNFIRGYRASRYRKSRPKHSGGAPVQTVCEFIAYAKANPGEVNKASAGNGAGITCQGSCSSSSCPLSRRGSGSS